MLVLASLKALHLSWSLDNCQATARGLVMSGRANR